jgi:hypothetical protein
MHHDQSIVTVLACTALSILVITAFAPVGHRKESNAASVPKTNPTSETMDVLGIMEQLRQRDQIVERLIAIVAASPPPVPNTRPATAPPAIDPEQPPAWQTAEDARKAAAIQALGYLRASEAVDVLVANLDFYFDDNPGGITYRYPATVALARIGVPCIPKIIEVLAKGPDEVSASQYERALLVLLDIHSPGMARRRIELEMQTSDQRRIANLRRALRHCIEAQVHGDGFDPTIQTQMTQLAPDGRRRGIKR